MTSEELITCLQGKENLVLLDRSFEDKKTSQTKLSPQTTSPPFTNQSNLAHPGLKAHFLKCSSVHEPNISSAILWDRDTESPEHLDHTGKNGQVCKTSFRSFSLISIWKTFIKIFCLEINHLAIVPIGQKYLSLEHRRVQLVQPMPAWKKQRLSRRYLQRSLEVTD